MLFKGIIVVRSFVVEVLIVEIIKKKYIENKIIRFMFLYGSYKSWLMIYCVFKWYFKKWKFLFFDLYVLWII